VLKNEAVMNLQAWVQLPNNEIMRRATDSGLMNSVQDGIIALQQGALTAAAAKGSSGMR
jgi:hypothetical protein